MRRLELALVTALTLAALALRAFAIDAAGIDHFDEGVYAFTGLGLSDAGQPHRLYPGQSRFAPLVHPATLAGSFALAGGPSDAAVVWPGVLLGTLTVPVLWWVGRGWLGPAAGVAAAALLAGCELHIALCRTGLSDPTFALLFVLALSAVVPALSGSAARAGSPARAALAGAAVGLAWNTKYHGWFAAVIAAGALAPVALARLREGAPLGPLVRTFAVLAGAAIACHLPWALYVQSEPGGYLALARYQSTMLEPGYLANLWRQVEHLAFLDGVVSRASLPAALLAAVLVAPGARSRGVLLAAAGAACALALGVGGALATAAIGVIAAPLLARRGGIPAWVLLGWVALFVVTTPLYHPYARLLLPLVVGCALAAGGGLAGLAGGAGGDRAGNALVAAVLAGIVFAVGWSLPDPSDPWRFSRGAARAADAIAEQVPAGERVVVVGEPAVAFHLHLRGRPAFERVEDPLALRDAAEPLYVVSGLYAKRARSLREAFETLGPRLEALDRIPLPVKDLRLLDDMTPSRARAFRAHPDDTHALTLYRLRPVGPGGSGAAAAPGAER